MNLRNLKTVPDTFSSCGHLFFIHLFFIPVPDTFSSSIRQVKGKKVRRIWVSALRDIQAGEELTIDYAWPADSAVRCLCGAETCRGWVVDKNELRKLYRMGVRRKVPSLETTQTA